jgi:hypothetical protein
MNALQALYIIAISVVNLRVVAHSNLLGTWQMTRSQSATLFHSSNGGND